MIQAGHFQGGNNNCLAIDGKCISFGRNQSKYIKIHLKNPKNNNKKKECQFCGCTHVCIVCVCVLEMRHWFGRSNHVNLDPYSQKRFFVVLFFFPIGGSADPGSLIRSLWSIRLQSLLKRQNLSRISLRTVLLEQRHKKTFR